MTLNNERHAKEVKNEKSMSEKIRRDEKAE